MRVLSAMLALAMAAGIGWAQKKNPKDDPDQIGNRDVGKGFNLYSIEREMALGKQLAEEVKRQVKLVEDPIVTEYVNRLGQNLARNSDARVPFTFQVIDGPTDYNAFALPGGFIFVYSGLIKMADEEDELAGALAHEIAHVAARHLTRRASKQEMASAATIPLSVILGGWAGYGARQAAGAVTPMLAMKFSRDDEKDADYLGVQYMYAAGYDPNGAISIFEKLQSLQRKNPGVIAKIFSSHPMDADRIQKTEKEIGKILADRPEYVVNTSDYREMRDRLLRLEGRRKGDPADGRPQLQRRTPDSKADEDSRPTIRRRDLIE